MRNDMGKASLDIAVAGIGAILPGAADSSMFWKNILEGKDLVEEIPSSHWLIEDYYDEVKGKEDKVSCKKGAFIPEVDFDPVEFGMPPTLLKSTDVIQLLALLAVKQVINDTVSLSENRLDRDRVSVILGASGTTQLSAQMMAKIQKPVWLKAMREHGLEEHKAQAICDQIFNSYPEWSENTFPGYLNNIIAGRISNRFNFRGINCSVDAACGSSLGALNMAVNELILGKSDLVITGGGDATSYAAAFFSFDRTHALSPTGDCRPFSEDADGTILGEGLAMFALRRLEDAERDGDKIYALIRGIGCSSDGKAKSIYAPSSEGQALAIRKAYESTGYKMKDVELIEAHGTGTTAGDRVEFSGLMKAYDGDRDKIIRRCAIGSVKSQIGHTKGAAGAAGLLKTIMALQHKVLPCTIKVTRPNGRMKIEQSPFYINSVTRPWIHDGKSTRKAAVSAFGFGGSNYHVSVEEYIGSAGKPLKIRSSPVELFLFSGKDVPDLKAGINELQSVLLEKSFSSAAKATQESFQASAHRRLAILAQDAEDLANTCKQASDKIHAAEDTEISIPDRLYYFIGNKCGKIAYVFPGQGSQYVNMGIDMAVAFDEVRSLWDRTAAWDFGESGNLAQVVFPVPAFEDADRKRQQEQLTETQWAQPAIGAMSISLLELLKKIDLKPDFAAGHSFGEVTSLYAAGVIPEAEAFIRISRKRGELMAQAASASSGTMTAVFASSDKIEEILKESNTRVCIANYNSPIQIVISGDTAEVEAVEKMLGKQAIAFKRLSVAAAFHSEHVKGSREPFYEYIKAREFHSPEFGVLSNISGELYPGEPEKIKETLAEQLTRAVRFREQIDNLYQQGARIFVEVGPNSAMSKLISDCLANREHYTVPLDRKGKNGVASFWNAMAMLSAIGVRLSFGALWSGFLSEDLPSKKLSPVSIKINGALYGRCYPPENGFISPPEPGPEANPKEPAKDSSPAVADIKPEYGGGERNEKYMEGERNINMGVNSREDKGLLSALLQIQESAAAAEEVFQKTITESHMAFIKAVEETMGQISSMNGTADTGVMRGMGMPSVLTSPEYLQISSAVEEAKGALQEKEAGAEKLSAGLSEAPGGAADKRQDVPDIKEILLEVVSEKTGYPVEMLQLDMDLEADLGIDSIKKVEILAGLSERLPQMSEIDPTSLASLKTLGEIIEQADGISHAAGEESVCSEKTANTEPAKTEKTEAADTDLKDILLQIVSDKTGYPVDMLELDMDMEADLGIDSIKRIEIFAALKEKRPELAESDISQVASLKTLREAIAYSYNPAEGLPLAPGRSDAGSGREMDAPQVHRYSLISRESPAELQPAARVFSSETIFITRDKRGIAEALAERFREVRAAVEIVDIVPDNARALIYLRGMELRPDSDFSACSALLQDAFTSARLCGKNIFDKEGLFVTVQDTGGNFGLGNKVGVTSWASGLSALAKTCSREWNRSRVKAIDIESGEMTGHEIAEELFKEIVYGGAEVEIGLTSLGKRLTLELEEADKLCSNYPLAENDLLIVTGGARGVTAHCLLELSKRYKLRFALLGRTKLIEEPANLEKYTTDAELKKAIFESGIQSGEKTPLEMAKRAQAVLAAREIRENISRLEANGALVDYYQVDIRNGEEVVKVVEEIRIKQGEIKGIIHGAGVLADKLLHEKTDEQFKKVFETKVHGFYNLLEATRTDRLSHICCFTSAAARFGNPGQSDYAMANEVLNKVCRYEFTRRGGKCLVKAINWGPWDGGMVTPFLKLQFENAGITLLTPQKGAEKFAEEINCLDEDAIEVVIGGVQKQ